MVGRSTALAAHAHVVTSVAINSLESSKPCQDSSQGQGLNVRSSGELL